MKCMSWLDFCPVIHKIDLRPDFCGSRTPEATPVREAAKLSCTSCVIISSLRRKAFFFRKCLLFFIDRKYFSRAVPFTTLSLSCQESSRGTKVQVAVNEAEKKTFPLSSSQANWNSCPSSAVYYCLNASGSAVISMLLRTVTLQWVCCYQPRKAAQGTHARAVLKAKKFEYQGEQWGGLDPQVLKPCWTSQGFPKSSCMTVTL